MTSRTTNRFSPEVRDRAVRLVLDHEGGSFLSVNRLPVDRDEGWLPGSPTLPN